MNPLTKPLSDITFEDVEEYCAERRPETTELDYKKQLPKDLSKHIAAMSNTFGGVIIIGVEEDKTGYPVKWVGVPDEGKLIDQIYQHAANVKPYPSCYVEKTNAKDGKVFLLIRILEGTAGPYYPVTDPYTVWMRTGNVSTPLKAAERDAIERITGKREKATATRAQNEIEAERLYEALLEETEKQRERDATRRGDIYVPLAPGDDFVPLRLLLQPYYPQSDLMGIKPASIKERLNDIRVRTGVATFPDAEASQAPGGIAWMTKSAFGYSFSCGQINRSGMLYWIQNVMQPANNHNRTPMIQISYGAIALFQFLEVAKRFYNSFGYHGLLTGLIELNNAKGLYVYPAVPDGRNWFGDPNTALLDKLKWPMNLDTHQLNDPAWLLNYHLQRMEEMYWDLRVSAFDRKVMTEVLQQAGLVVNHSS